MRAEIFCKLFFGLPDLNFCGFLFDIQDFINFFLQILKLCSNLCTLPISTSRVASGNPKKLRKIFPSSPKNFFLIHSLFSFLEKILLTLFMFSYPVFSDKTQNSTTSKPASEMRKFLAIYFTSLCFFLFLHSNEN